MWYNENRMNMSCAIRIQVAEEISLEHIQLFVQDMRYGFFNKRVVKL